MFDENDGKIAVSGESKSVNLLTSNPQFMNVEVYERVG